jgi:hypothetical protein
MLDDRPAGEPLDVFLERKGINLFYLDELLLQRLAATAPGKAEPFLSDAGDSRWELLGGSDKPGNHWKLFRRVR